MKEAIPNFPKDQQEFHRSDTLTGEVDVNKLSNTELFNYGIQIKEESIELKLGEPDKITLPDPLSLENLIERGGKARVYVDSSSISKNLIENYISSRSRKDDTPQKTPRSEDSLTTNTKTIGSVKKLALMDHQEAYKLRLCDQNVYCHPKTGYEYQIYYKGQPIDKDKMEQLVREKFAKNKSGQLICGVHEKCNFTKSMAGKRYPPRFERSLKRHIETFIVTYLCRDCFTPFGCYTSLCSHFRRHDEQDIPSEAKRVLQDNSELVLMDYQNKFPLSLSDENILFTPMGQKYQVYYKGQAIGIEDQKEIIQSLANESESGWLLCSVPHECSFREPRGIDKVRFNASSVIHLKKYHFTYLCRYCLGTYSSFNTFHEHSRLHAQNS